ncbi:MAG TPA: DNA mismatch repair protein MutS, partial [Terriglobia bacterium]|nr:DNA mismatch repair protein MutS [Terriglobia bacterium]
PALRALLVESKAARFRELGEELDELADLRELLERALSDSPPAATAEGGFIRDGYHAELDELRQLSRGGKQTIAQMESRERQATGIASLKIKFNNIFGYYIEVSKPNLPLVPDRFERKQTLVNAERFTTPELKEYERKVLDAEERMQQIETQLFAELRAAVGEQAARIRRTAAAVAELDVLCSFAVIAAERAYCRPSIADDGVLEIRAGRHPVLERLAESLNGERFVPNDLYMNEDTDRILIITGPNMGGKSTYLRQAALISILAQMGSFVPAASARLPLLDRIYTRIGASDNLARGRSTFMVEMTETAVILNTAGPRSLVILDEIGRGTATFDGLSIAWAVVEYLHSRPGIKALFATHYHELTELADHLPGVKNRHVSVKESDGNIVFLRRVEPGSADRSYGIEVARLAGLPAEVIERAREVLNYHEQSEHRLSDTLAEGGARSGPSGSFQLTLFTPSDQALRERLARIKIEELKPLEALNLLAEIQKNLVSGGAD